MAQDHGLCREKGKSKINGPVHGPPLQARVAAANGTVLAAGKLLALTTAGPDRRSWRTWNGTGQSTMKQLTWTGASKMNGGKNLMRAVGMAGKNGRQTARRTGTAGRHSRRFSARLRPQNTRPTDGRPCSKQQLPQMTSASRRAGKWGECKGVGTEEGGLRPT